ncbi:amino acid adenylation domain-containing protein [Actinospica durhamensis]|uniref:Amino acid adenylation domain-containing protein n=1 Tax=Actinospica durhamensis TaxID=1508375 RepID=A0A941ENE5_9ACTN|nr:non-ribosomal peptide synthetase [Actinospica durhamensis]MBR7834887.1 amino acid adenylation domain-containing protein [Actinospica durhamensis]
MPNVCTGLLERALAHPEAVALRSQQMNTTYAQLCAQALAVRRELHAAGVGPGSRVAVAMPSGPGFAAVIVAVASLGATYVPLDLNHASERSGAIITHARCAVVVHGGSTGGWSPPPGPVLLDAASAAQHAAPGWGLTLEDLVEPGPGHPLYIMYTSGSTGSPKGVLVPHEAVSQLIESAGRCMTLEPGLVWAATHSPAFDFSVWELWGALLTGGTVSFAAREQILDPAALAGFVRAEDIGVFSQTPSSFRRIAESPELLAAAENLRYIVFGGEALQSDTVRTWTDRNGFSRPELVNMYGITETTVHTTWRILDREALGTPVCPIGAALPGRSVLVCDQDGVPVPSGSVGELFVGGAGLALGYLDDPELSAQRFVTLATARGPERFYRSGDLGYEDQQGDLHYRGRADRQVKIRGHRIALEEVEAAARRLDAVADAVVLAARRPGEDEQSLVAHLVPAAAGPLDLAACALALRAVLPGFMVPARLTEIPALPLNRNGKIDTDRLPDPWAASDASACGAAGAYQGDAQAAIRATFAQVLLMDPAEVGSDTDFFLLGGDSIMALRVFVEAPWLRERLTLLDLYQYPTVKELAEAWAGASASAPDGGGRAEPDAPAEAFALTRAQETLLFEWFGSDYRLYQDGMLVRALLPVDLPTLARHARALGEAHPAARLRFDLDAIGAEVRVQPRADVPVVVADDSALPLEAAMDTARDWMRQSCATPFDLAGAPPLRIRVAKLEDGSFVLTVVVHHVVCDGWSLNVLFSDLIDVARGTRTVEEIASSSPDHVRILRALPELERDDIAAVRAAKGPEQLAHLLSAGAAAAPDPQPRSASREEVAVEIDEETASAAAAFAQKARVPVKSVYVAAHLRAAGTAYGRSLVSCIPISGRPDLPGADRCIGYFVRPRLIVVPDDPENTALGFVQEVWAAERELMRTRLVPLADQLGTRGELPVRVHMNFVDFHVLESAADALLGVETYDETGFPLTVDVKMRRTRGGRKSPPLLAVSGLLPRSRLEHVAQEHVAALRALVG